MTLREAESLVEQQLRRRDDLTSRARDDARHLIEIATGRNRAARLAHPEAVLTSEQQQRLDALVVRRMRAEPMQHLRGSQEFYGRDFLVSPDVLIPRPETEDMVTAVLEATPDRTAPVRIADVGTGSGALAITLALELPQSQVVAFELSPAAIAVAEANAQALGAADRVAVIESDLMSAAEYREPFDIVVSNPPYIPLVEAPSLHAEVRDYEPHLALFAGEDGHAIYRRLIPEAAAHLRPGGLLLLETGGRVDLIQQMLRADFDQVAIRLDLQGIARIVEARRH